MLARMLRLAGHLQQNAHGGQTAESLARFMGVSRRTIFRDLRVLRMAGLSVEYSKRDGGFRWQPFAACLAETVSVSQAAALLTLLGPGLVPRQDSLYEHELLVARQKLVSLLLHMLMECRDIVEAESEEFCASDSMPRPVIPPLR